jgi:hypothetical protein
MTDASESVFTVSSVWCCPSTTRGAQNALRYTIDAMKPVANSFLKSQKKEIHHSDGLGQISATLLETALHASHSDNSILRGDGIILKEPLCWRTVDFSPEFEHQIANGNEPCGNWIRARSIVSNLRPLLTFQKNGKFEVGVVLDSEVWGKALELCKYMILDNLKDKGITISFDFERSNRIPGLQIADMVSGVARQYYRNQKEQDAFDLVRKHSFEHLKPIQRPK